MSDDSDLPSRLKIVLPVHRCHCHWRYWHCHLSSEPCAERKTPHVQTCTSNDTHITLQYDSFCNSIHPSPLSIKVGPRLVRGPIMIEFTFASRKYYNDLTLFVPYHPHINLPQQDQPTAKPSVSPTMMSPWLSDDLTAYAACGVTTVGSARSILLLKQHRPPAAIITFVPSKHF